MVNFYNNYVTCNDNATVQNVAGNRTLDLYFFCHILTVVKLQTIMIT